VICSASKVRAISEVLTSFVWKQRATWARDGITHWTSMTISSTAPVRMASSCWRKFPATGSPCRISTSLAVQQIPATVMPVAPTAAAAASRSGSWDASANISESVGSCPWMMRLTVSSPRTPRLTRL